MKFGGIVIVGIGGTGVLKASEILSRFLLYQGFDVRQSEVHGMAQRGGSVITHLKYGEKVYSPLLGKGEAQFMIATEEVEALRYSEFLSSDATIIINTWRLNPVGTKPDPYTGFSARLLREKGIPVYEIDANSIAESLQNSRVANSVLIGAFSKIFNFDNENIWEEVIKETFPQKLFDINLTAFLKGRESIAKIN
ncbi:MAG: indolepyruvate oxidoreductase subunit beta [Atribacter sp.]|jgi:indolepyruvate ferredoxin oxidoreductase beta subunit|uniref:indolepyruvate oxidoreductase subunit beta n=1 Tax=Atribacter sp. TaxID=2847780 RepID=UPI001760CEA0|nr:indolepyruvate oxidoreductase subunit beta [Atribacterota bacterium]HHT10840.1 indolepyruvate oxidoreductase subunit beta [Candidatus Atribacteria bacterium]